MKTLLMLIPLILLCCPGCQQGERVLVEPKADVEADIQAIKEKIAELNSAVNAGDLYKLISIYGDDAVRIPPNEPPSIGKEAIQQSAEQMFDNLSPREEKDVVENVQVSGNLAVAHIKWSSLITPKTGSEPFDVNGNWILVFKRESDNSWKIIYSIWNDETLVHPDQAE
ncbi:MAG: SgcJ/EcaC family oxidoreductase [Acidobacteria bacterium]|nr:SgcJ/EcaC family oxidoreductase [Acidobacteriota bacterium]